MPDSEYFADVVAAMQDARSEAVALFEASLAQESATSARRAVFELTFAELFRQRLAEQVDLGEVAAAESAVWPDSAIRLTRIIGVEATRLLCASFGGRRGWYVPHQPRAHNAFLRVLGPERMAALVAVYGGQKLDIPNLESTFGRKKQAILALLNRGLSYRAIAERARCTEGYVHMTARILSPK
jgi:hypothetical protein